MTIDANPQRFGPLNFDHHHHHHHHMSSYSSQPHFTNPWVSSSSTGAAPQSGSHSLFVSNQDASINDALPRLNVAGLAKHPQHGTRGSSTSSNASIASYGSIPVTATSAGSPLMTGVYGRQDTLTMGQDLLAISRLQHPTTSTAYGEPSYTTATSTVTAAYATSSAPYELGYAPAPMRGAFALGPESEQARRYSQPGIQHDDRRSFQDALEASHGMLSMSQETPRNIYDVRNRGRGSGDSYGFPSTHSASSSTSSTGFSGYYGGSVDSSVSDYSTAGSDIESLSGRTLPRPQGLMSSQVPPAPQSMMGQFSSKVSSSTQKKHKCRVCDKRFTRPSSLQTHMYSHTGEKPFSCEVEGCGRHFSVVSNLRRHRKVHKSHHEKTPSEAGSDDHPQPELLKADDAKRSRSEDFATFTVHNPR